MGRRYSAPNSSRGRRQALLRNQLADLILAGSLVTTETRAKSLKREVERLVSRARGSDLAVRRKIFALLPKREAVERLWQIAAQFKDRQGGYVRLVRLSARRGDNAPMARIEFIEKIKEQKKEVEAGEAKKAAPSRQKQAVSGKKSNGRKNEGDKSKRS